MEENIVWENDWAEYKAMDKDGNWFEYESKPIQKYRFWDLEHRDSACRKKIILKHNWKESLIKRERNIEMNSKIKTVQLYETIDNSVFRDLKEAEEHQKLLNLADFLCDIFVEKSILHRDSFKKAIMKNKEEITKIIFNRKEQ